MSALAYLREHRGLVLQWFAVLAGPASWSAQFIVSYNVTDTGACAPAGSHYLASGGFRPVGTGALYARLPGECLMATRW